MAPMTEYELMRERNIANNRATLASLGLEFGAQLLSGPDKPAENSTRMRKRKLAVADDVASSPRRSLRRRNRSSAGENPDDEFEYQSLDESDHDEESDLAKSTSRTPRRYRIVHHITTRRYREPVIKASGNYRVICIRHPDSTYEEAGKVTSGAPTPPTTNQSESQPSSPSSPAPAPALKGLSKDQRDLARSKIFGHQPRVPIGRWYPGRRGFHDALVHRGLVNGIFGDEGEGAYSVSVSGGYEDDIDEGYKFVFTGEGGRHLNVDPKTGRAKNLRTAPQTRAQGMRKGNLALKRSCETGNPVRVIRGYKGKSVWAPREGYRYDGLYQVLKVWEDTGLSGYPVFRFAFIRLPDQPPIDTSAGPGSWTEEEVEKLKAMDEVKRLLKNSPKKMKSKGGDEEEVEGRAEEEGSEVEEGKGPRVEEGCEDDSNAQEGDANEQC